jgi:hypothetical protein
MTHPIARKGRAVSATHPPARRRRFLPIACLAIVASASWLAGCPTTSTLTAYTPITGIVIRSADLVAGHGCGTGPDQVYKYVAVLAYAAGGSNKPKSSIVPFTSTVVSCYTDGIFSNLQGSAGSNPYDFTVYVYAYNATSFPPALACTPDTAGGCPGDNPCSTATPCDAGVEPRYPPNWTATCSATELAGVPALATCGALEPVTGAADAGAPPTTIAIGTQAFLTTDGGLLSCGTDYTSVAATLSQIADSGAPSTLSAVACPAPIVVPVPAAATTYTIEVSLTRADATEIAQTTCKATATPGNIAYAACSAAQPGTAVVPAIGDR